MVCVLFCESTAIAWVEPPLMPPTGPSVRAWRGGLRKTPKSTLRDTATFSSAHLERAQFYDSLARRALTQPVRHTLLLHHNALNALFIDDLIAMFVERRWQPVDAEYAYSDPVMTDNRNLARRESLIWALAKEKGSFETELRYPGENDIYENPKMDILKL